jgi:two-component system response regulator NreC
MTIRILIADDHSIVRAGLRSLLNEEPDFDVVGQVGSGEEAFNMAMDLDPDLVLMDLSMSGIGGLETTRRIIAKKPECRVLVLTMHDDNGLLREAINAGASGYILKRAVQSELVHAIHVVLRGDIYIHPTLTRALFVETNPPASSEVDLETITPRELDVLRLIAHGYTNSQIAEDLSISVRTVEFHRSNLMLKLDAHSRVDLVRYASEHGIISD